MPKSKRLSVPIDRQTENYLRDESSRTGQSVAVLFSKLAAAGLQQRAIDEQLSDLKSSIKNQSGGVIDSQIFEKIDVFLSRFSAEINTKIDQIAASKPAEKDGLFLPEKAAILLFEEALFSSALSSEIMAADLQTNRQAGGVLVARARQRAKATLRNFLIACREEA